MTDLARQRRHSISGYTGVVDHIRREISLGRLVPGDRLPAERKLAEELGVARETLRQALRVLEGSGQVTVRRGTTGGAVVQDTAVDPEMIRLRLRAEKDQLLSLLEFRIEIECAASRFAASRRTDVDLTAMRDAQDELLAATNKDESRRADTAMHLAVARAAGNAHLAAAVEDARAETFHPIDLATFDFIKESSHTEHAHIIVAITDGDGDGAAQAMRDHIEHTRIEMLAIIEQ
jgi:GntR family transcriptional regulator, transcriptional repressor for pyruvate dehydrogenase complex